MDKEDVLTISLWKDYGGQSNMKKYMFKNTWMKGQAEKSLGNYFYFYNHERPHQSFGNQTPFEVYQAGLKTKEKKEQKELIFDHQKLSQNSRFAV